MSDSTESENLREENISPNEFLNEKEHGWFVLSRYLTHYGLNFLESGLYTILVNLSGRKGFAYPSNDFLCEELGIKKSALKDKLVILKDKNLIYIHIYSTQKGRRREIVTRESAGAYYSYLHKNNRDMQLEKFKEKFLTKISSFSSKKYYEPKLLPEKESENTSFARPDSGHPARPDSGHAYNTTYYKYRTSDVTCKRAEAQPAPEGAAHAAVSLPELKKELESTFSPIEVAMGLDWYEMQSQKKKSSMKKPIACIVQALKKGYAQQEIEVKNKEVKVQIKKEKEEAKKKELKRKERQENYEFSQEVIKKFSLLPGWSHRVCKECFTVHNDSLHKGKDEQGLSFVELPDKTRHYGLFFLRAELSLPPKEFRKEVKKFLKQCLWTKEKTTEKQTAV